MTHKLLISLTVFFPSTCGPQFHLLIGVEEPATLLQNVAFSLIFVNETPTIKAEALATSAAKLSSLNVR